MIKPKLIEYFDERWYKFTVEKENGSEDIYIPSVTTKLGIISKPFLARWRGDIGNREADLRLFEAQERGTRIHHAWYTMTTGGAVVYQPFQRPNYNHEEIQKLTDEYAGNVAIVKYQDEMIDVWKLKRWMDIVKPKIIASELNVYSLKNRDAGTTDNVAEIQEGEYDVNGAKPLKLPHGLYIIDLKSGNSVDDNAFYQTAAYGECHEEMGLGEINGSIVLHTQAQTRKGIEGLATLYHSKEQMKQDYQDYRLAAALWERKNADAKPKLFEFPTLLTLGKDENDKNAE